MTSAPLHLNPAQLRDFLGRARWFGGKGRDFEVSESRAIALSDSVWIELAEVTYDDGDTECYQLPLVSYDWPQDRLAHALVEFVDGKAVYDAVHDREAMSVWLSCFATARRVGDLEFHRMGSPNLDTTTHSTLF
ncbi:MAG TPA: hypothetical protein PLO27_05580, partial [Marmoricola sp.]|nr:hypothetical protein [Marmoricola sp.]